MMMDVYDDRARPLYPDIVRKIREYDPRLFLRWNRTRNLWELWRWNEWFLIPDRVHHIPPAEIVFRATKQLEVTFHGLDQNFCLRLRLTDLYALSPDGNLKNAMKAIEKREAEEEVKNKKAVRQMCREMAEDFNPLAKRVFAEEACGVTRRPHEPLPSVCDEYE